MATNYKDVDSFRKWHLAIAEFVDAWRLIPRLIIAGYSWLLYKVITWYMGLHAYLPSEVLSKVDSMTPEQIKASLISAPTTQHAALVTAVVGIAAAIFGLYSSTSRKWNEFTMWNKKDNAN